MKKLSKLIFILAMTAATACTCALAGCSQKQTVTGEISYTQYGTNYGIRVSVEVQSDKGGDRISKVTVLDSDFVEASEWEGKEDWDKNLDTLLLAYRGEYVADILAKKVAVDGDGAPLGSDTEGFVDFGKDFITTGATVGSGRLLLAIQDALKQLNK